MIQPKQSQNLSEASDDISALTAIYNEDINIAIWQRETQAQLDQYAQAWVKRYPAHAPRLLLNVSKADEQLDERLPELDNKSAFKQDLLLIVDMFACLFDLEEVGLRLSPLTKAMCPRFHVDNIPCRLVTTYGGLGTEWLREENVDRSRLGKGAKGLPDDQSGILRGNKSIQQLKTQEIALLKGCGWLGNEDHGLVHRSPSLSADQSRVLLSLDFS